MIGLKPAPRLPRDQLTVIWQSASLLLAYPDSELAGRVALIERAASDLSSPVRELLEEACAQLVRKPPLDLQQEYVETFDGRRRCNLYLTYFAHGDTRKRGMALLRFKQAYLRSGYVLDDTELPDHLCVVLEYAATVDQDRGFRLLTDHRAGLELLRISLRDEASPYAPVLEAICATLPAIRGDERDAVRRLAAEGPPEEEVGLTPYGVDLPSPSFPGRRR